MTGWRCPPSDDRFGLAGGEIHVWMTAHPPDDRLSESPYEILARYTRQRIPSFEIGRSPSGKPMLGEGDPLAFNLSHSGDWSMLAVGRVGQLGIDVERIRPIAGVERLARRFFSQEEANVLLRLPAEERIRAFFRTWVRKEAYLKGLGGGVPSRLRCFTVAASDEAPEVLSTDLEGVAGRSSWSLVDLEAPDGYAAALAIDGEAGRIRVFGQGNAEKRGDE